MSDILIVEDEHGAAEYLWTKAREAGHVPSVAFTVKNATELIDVQVPDVVLLDWMLSDMTGLSFLRTLRATMRTRDLPVIMLSARPSEADCIRALNAGADFYLAKPFSVKELFARVAVVLRPKPITVEPDVLHINGLSLSLKSHRVVAKRDEREAALALKPTQFKLLRLFLLHPEQVFSRDEILEHVWTDQPDAKARTVDVHVKYLRDALRPLQFDTMIETVLNEGYRLSRIDARSEAGRG
ncbi:winged helix-turn-helix domain-containing protein [Pararobbsia alpina]|uniref:Phosphate regulon transcriptional regulatory protein PhoB n=1 Tax=Pararobbsia alpina TaxID=621374 RepID=A0A6S7BMM2_9BURK|nr:winged helix-turn-helix domain-containing protein [Pararobbsia alpina]CAB3806218.1 Phosphate regulon transcriptional regulatory protein PhoB [Pararobbsia alpina]